MDRPSWILTFSYPKAVTRLAAGSGVCYLRLAKPAVVLPHLRQPRWRQSPVAVGSGSRCLPGDTARQRRLPLPHRRAIPLRSPPCSLATRPPSPQQCRPLVSSSREATSRSVSRLQVYSAEVHIQAPAPRYVFRF